MLLIQKSKVALCDPETYKLWNIEVHVMYYV